jgi:hypothetical protein
MPALAPIIETLDKVAEPLRQFYEQKEGKFHLILEGAPPGFVTVTDHNAANAKVVEFRDNNVKLLKEVEELRPLKTKFEGLDPEAAKTAIAELAELKKKGVTKPDDVTAVIQTAVDAAIKPLKDQLVASQTAAEADRKRADEGTLRSVIGEKFLKAGGKAKALDYIIAQAGGVFSVENGSVKAAPNKFSTVKAGEALSVEEWIGSLAKEHDFAFEPSRGGGAPPTGGGPGGPTLKAGQTILKNPTPQQLGEHAKDIKDGKYLVQYDDPATAGAAT